MRVESWEAETGNNGESGRQREVAVVRVLAWEAVKGSSGECGGQGDREVAVVRVGAWEAETGNGEGGGLGGRDKKW